MQGSEADLQSLVSGRKAESGVKGGSVLLGFVESVVAGGDKRQIESSRSAVVRELGEAAMVDAAAVLANFQRMVRIADSTGIPLDEPVVMMTQGIREDLQINQFSAAQRTPELGLVKRVVGRMLGRFAPQVLRRLARRRST